MLLSFTVLVVAALLLTILTGAQATDHKDASSMTRESVKAQIEELENFLAAKAGNIHPSKLQNHWLQLAMLYQVMNTS
jgi:hypothetical protein